MAADTQLNVTISAKDEASDKIKGIEGATNSFKSTLMTLGGVVAGAFAVDKIVEFGKDSFDAFNESEKAMASVKATLASMGGEATKQLPAIEKLSAGAVQLGFDDEDAAKSIARFYQATGDMTKAQNLANIAMDLARAKNIDLVTAGTLVNQVLSGNGRALKAYQINIKDSATPLEALGILHDKVAGQAQAFADTTGGKIAVLKVEYQNFQEVVGGLIANILTPMLGWLVKIADGFQSLGDIQQKINMFLDAIDKKSGIITFFKQTWTDLVNEYNDNLKPALDQLWQALIPLEPLFKVIGEVIGIVVVGAIEGAVLALKGWILLLSKIIEVLAPVIDWFTHVLTPVFSGLSDEIQKTIKLVQDLINALSNVGSAVGGALSKVGGLIGKGASAVASIIPHADGGSVVPGQTYLVGERGAELFRSNTAGSIVPNNQLGGSGVTVIVNGGNYLDAQAAKYFGDLLARTIGQQLKLRTI